MHRLLMFLGYSLLVFSSALAQRRQSQLQIVNSFHSLPVEVLARFNNHNTSGEGFSPRPYVLYADGFTVCPFHDIYFNTHGITVKLTSQLSLVKESSDVEISFNLTDVTREGQHMTLNCGSGSDRWIVKIKDGRGKGRYRKGIVCLPPLAPRGKELFLYAKAKIDMRDESKCVVTYWIKEKKSRKPLALQEWPSEEEFKNRVWISYKDESDGITYDIYHNGLTIARGKE